MLSFGRKAVSASSATLWTAASQASLHVGSPRHDRCGLLSPSPEDLSNQGLSPHLLLVIILDLKVIT